jgi:hypothetical protein
MEKQSTLEQLPAVQIAWDPAAGLETKVVLLKSPRCGKA